MLELERGQILLFVEGAYARYRDVHRDYEKFLEQISFVLNEEVSLEFVRTNFREVGSTIMDEPQTDEEGGMIDDDPLFLSDTEPINTITDMGWLTPDEVARISGSLFYKKVIDNASNIRQQAITDDIRRSTFHILGRCNNPNDWGNNRQGLVVGMVQSGKTVSMINLIAQAKVAGYRGAIILAGLTTSLREQTQDRVDTAFNLVGGYNNEDKIISPTSLGEFNSQHPLAEGQRGQMFGLEAELRRGGDWFSILIIQKNVNVLRQMVKAIRRTELHSPEFNERGFLIIDDEADYASQNTAPLGIDPTSINNEISNLRNALERNCYVGYTATPQACVSADPNNPVGYPRDFIWLLEPFLDTRGRTVSYLGLKEYYEDYGDMLIHDLGQASWPYHDKDNQGRRLGVVSPFTGEITDERLTVVETAFLNGILNEEIGIPREFIYALADYLVGCAVKWAKHYDDLPEESKRDMGFPNLLDIQNGPVEIQRSSYRYREFPFHAVMINASYINQNQRQLRQVISQAWNHIRNAWEELRNSPVMLEDNVLSQRAMILQSRFSAFGESVPEWSVWKRFIQLAIDETERPINEQMEFIYLLNVTEDERLRYGDNLIINERTKKAAIVIGGNVLSRGLTIEGLCVTVFARTQALSLGDTNLQMCRWFGHKRAEILYIHVYMNPIIRFIFRQITKCDMALRMSIKRMLRAGKSPTQVRLAIRNDSHFMITSQNKKRLMERIGRNSSAYSGKTETMQFPFDCDDPESNVRVFNQFRETLSSKYEASEMHNRGSVYGNVDINDLRNLFDEQLSFWERGSITPRNYLDYLDEWHDLYLQGQLPNDIPPINIAIMNGDSETGLTKRKREMNIRFPTSIEMAKTNAVRGFAPILGGSRQTSGYKFLGDIYLDKSIEWHIEHSGQDLRSLRTRGERESILLIFHYLDSNYVTRTLYEKLEEGEYKKLDNASEVRFEAGDEEFNEFPAVLTFSAVTPLGGPIYSEFANKAINPEDLENESEIDEELY